jgi:hypothetical protein
MQVVLVASRTVLLPFNPLRMLPAVFILEVIPLFALGAL